MSTSCASSVNLDNAKQVNIICRQGDTFSLLLNFFDANNAPMDLTAYTWKMDVKESDNAPTPVLNDDDFTYNGTSTGSLTISANAITMQDIEEGVYVYDLQSNVGGIVKTWIYGTFSVNPDISI
jgi:hypothetical protein